MKHLPLNIRYIDLTINLIYIFNLFNIFLLFSTTVGQAVQIHVLEQTIWRVISRKKMGWRWSREAKIWLLLSPLVKMTDGRLLQLIYIWRPSCFSGSSRRRRGLNGGGSITRGYAQCQLLFVVVSIRTLWRRGIMVMLVMTECIIVIFGYFCLYFILLFWPVASGRLSSLLSCNVFPPLLMAI